MVDLNISFPESFLRGEERDGYYVSEKMKKVWAVELDLLQMLLNVCKVNDIRIFASAGTLLGAVRHRGFIPWDDDIDLRIFRDDYEKLCSIASNCFQYPYFFQTEYNDLGSLRGHAQLRNSETTGILKSEFDKRYKFNQGIFIDIFPMDYVPNDEKLRAEQKDLIEKYRKKAKFAAGIGSRYYSHNENIVKKFARKALHYVAGGYFEKMELNYYKCFEKECKKYYKSSDLLTTVSFPGDYGITEVEDYASIIEMPFEFINIPVAVHYDKILTRMYGDYHKISIGTSVHGDIIFNTNISYKEYFKQSK